MAVGFKYDLKPQDNVKELCRFDTVYRLSGGFNLVTEGLEQGRLVPPLTPLTVDFAARKATVVKNVRVVADISDTQLKVEKGSFAYKGMHLGTGAKGATVESVDKSNVDFDVLTLSATIAGVKAGDVLFEATAVGGTKVKNVANALNYAYVKVETGATVTGIGQVFEIKSADLPAPISEADKANLGDRFLFV